MLHKLFTCMLVWVFSQPASAMELPDFTSLVEQQGATVVNISTTQIVRQQHEFPGMPHLPNSDPFFEFFKRFEPQMPKEQALQSLGSGFIISDDGYIMTNAHVVGNADGITVRLTDKREFKAKVIGADKRTDVAVIKIEASGLLKVRLGDPNALKVGEWVLAIGSPFGFENSVTAGIVSAKGRSIPQENYVPFIQTDAAINPGNSGGPLFNTKGEVIGINSQIYTRNGGSMGLSFAIPIDVAMDVVKQLRTSGKVTRGRIGVVIQEVTRDLAESFGLSNPSGALVSSVEKGGAADKAGIQVSDVILKFNGKIVNSSNDLPRIVASTAPGSKVPVQLWRRGGTKEVTLVVGEMPNEDRVAQGRRNNEPAPGAGENIPRVGLVLSELTEAQKQELKINGGLLVEEVKSATARTELRPGDIILSVGNVEVHTLDEFNALLKKIPKGRNIALLVRREDIASYIALKLDEKVDKD